jgi:two-component system NarL family sensor kinase
MFKYYQALFCSKIHRMRVCQRCAGIVLLFIPFIALGQNKVEIDSLNKLLNNPKISSTSRVDILNSLGNIYARTDSAKASEYAAQAKKITTNIKYPVGDANTLMLIGIIQTSKNHLSEAIKQFNNALKIFIAAKDNRGAGLAYANMGKCYLDQNRRQEAIDLYKKAEQLHREGKNFKELINDLNSLGVTYSQADDKQTAIQYYLEAATLCDKTGQYANLPSLYINIGKLMYNDKSYQQAQLYFFKAITILKNENEQIDLGIAYLNLSNTYIDQSNYAEGIKQLNAALSAFVKSNFVRGIQASYNNLGAINLRIGKFGDAIPLLEKSITVAQTAKNFNGLALTQQNIGYAYMKLGDYKKAAMWYNDAERSAIKYKNNPTVFGEIHNHRSMLDSLTGNYQNAFIERNKYITIKDSLLNETLSKQINDLQTRYETEKKQKQIEQLNSKAALQAFDLKNKDLELSKSKLENINERLALDKSTLQLTNQQLELGKRQSLIHQQKLESDTKGQKIKLLNNQNVIQKLEISKRNTTIMIIAIFFLIALLMGYQFYSRYKLKQDARLQAEVLHQQTLAAKGIIEAEERERKRIAAELHDGVGQLFTTVKMNMEILMERFLVKQPDADQLAEKTMAMVDESCTEVRSIAHQMMPNALIKSGLVAALRDFINKIPAEKLKISMETKGIDKPLESTTETVLYRVIQESVNNVIKHANATSLDILLLCDANEITVSIEDNGRGFNTADNSKFTGIGLKNMISRVEYLKGSVDISSSPGKGTLVAIFIPLT